MRASRNVRRISLLGVYLVLLFFTFLSLYPLFFAAVTSLKTLPEYVESKLTMPDEFRLDNYRYVIENSKLGRYMVNTILLVSFGLLLYLLVCNAAGYAFGKLKFRFRLVLFLLVIFLQIFPQMVVAGQLYRICASIGLINTYLGIIITWTAYFAPFGTYIMTTYYSSVPKEIVESARIDGANVWQQLIRIMIPISRPMLVTIAIIGTLSMWNELPFSLLLLQDQTMRTLTLGIAMMQGEHGLPVPALSAGILLISVIPIALFLLFQRYVTMGATAGSLKA